MPNIPRLYKVNTNITHVPLRVPFAKIGQQTGISPKTLRKMGITPDGIQVDTLKQFLAARKRPLEKLPLRQIAYDEEGMLVKPDFREETLQAILGRYSRAALVPRYGEYHQIAAGLLQAFADGNVEVFFEAALDLPPKLLDEIGLPFLLFSDLDLIGLQPPAALSFRLPSGIDSRLREIGEAAEKLTWLTTGYFFEKIRTCVEAGYLPESAWLFFAFLLEKAGHHVFLADCIREMTSPDKELCLQFARSVVLSDSLSAGRSASRILEHIGAIKEAVRTLPLEDLKEVRCRDVAVYYGAIRTLFIQALGQNNARIAGLSSGGVATFSDILLYLNIYRLAKEYDLVIMIAKQGLRGAAMVELSGTPYLILDAHGHNGRAKVGWLTKVDPLLIKKKRVLVIEDDVVSGKTLALACGEIQKFQPAEIELLLTNPATWSQSSSLQGLFTKIIFLEQVSCADTVELLPAVWSRGKAFRSRDKNEQSLQEGIEELVKQFQSFLQAASVPKAKAALVLRQLYRALFVIAASPLEEPAVFQEAWAQVRRLRKYLDEIKPIISDPVFRTEIKPENRMGLYLQALPGNFRQGVARGIFAKQTEDYFDDYYGKLEVSSDTPLSTIPNDLEISLSQIQKIIEEREFDLMLVVGPEGGKFVAPFAMANFPIASVHIDDFDPARPLCQIDDLEMIRGKRVLLLEDDVATGATLRRTLEHILPFEPREVSLFLGNREEFQTLSNVPEQIGRIYLPGQFSESEAKGAIDWFLDLAGITILKN